MPISNIRPMPEDAIDVAPVDPSLATSLDAPQDIPDEEPDIEFEIFSAILDGGQVADADGQLIADFSFLPQSTRDKFRAIIEDPNEDFAGDEEGMEVNPVQLGAGAAMGAGAALGGSALANSGGLDSILNKIKSMPIPGKRI